MTKKATDGYLLISQLDSHDMIGTNIVSRVMDVSKRTLSRWVRTGRIPRPSKPGQGLRWQVGEFRAWIDAGCPRASEWMKVRAV